MISTHKIIYNIFGAGIYHKPLPSYKSKSQEFHNKTLVFSSEMILLWLNISWGCTDTCRRKNFSNQPYRLQNSSVSLSITNFKNQLGIFMIISRGKGAMYFLILYFLPTAWQLPKRYQYLTL